MKNTKTLVYERRHKHFKTEEQANKYRLEHAFKLAGKSSLNASPKVQIAVLEDYVQALRDLIQELIDGYGPEELKDSLWRVEIEISRAVSQVTDLKLGQIKPPEV